MIRHLEKARKTFHEYPNQFWILILAVFVDRLGGALVFPFFALYVSQKFDVGLVEVGYVMMVWGVMGFVGGVIGGALTDRFGRKLIICIQLVMSAVSTLGMALSSTFPILLLASVGAGLFFEIGQPARQAMIADMLKKEQYGDGYGILRVAINVAVVLGPVIGGFVATRSYLLLFMADAFTSIVMTVIVIFAIRETWQPAQKENLSGDASTPSSVGGYISILRDGIFLTFVITGTIINLVYTQMYTTLPVFLRDVHGMPPQGYGYVMSLNATIVVLFQIWTTRKLRSFSPMLVLAGASLCYAVGFTLYGFVTSFAMFLAAMAIITVGEMVYFPLAQAFVADTAPENMRGRYMALFGLSFMVPSATGTLIAGWIVELTTPGFLWYVMGMGGVVCALIYLVLFRTANRTSPAQASLVNAIQPEQA